MTEKAKAEEPGTGAPVTGELVDPPAAAIIPSVAEENSAADRARGRTAAQLTTPFAILVIFTWALRLAGVDLDPGPGVDLPTEVGGAWVTVFGLLLAIRMNPKKK